MTRRGLLKIFLAFLGSITLFSFAYSLLKFLTALPSKAGEAKKLVMHKNDVPAREARNIVFQNMPAVIVNHPDKGFIAFSRVCTHLGCLVEYHRGQQRFICPCHAGIFDLEGSVISGPPPKPLATIPLRIDGENIVIG